MGLIACHYRAAEWRHKEIELAAHDLLQLLDRTLVTRSGSWPLRAQNAPALCRLRLAHEVDEPRCGQHDGDGGERADRHPDSQTVRLGH